MNYISLLKNKIYKLKISNFVRFHYKATSCKAILQRTKNNSMFPCLVIGTIWEEDNSYTNVQLD